ncbi:MAG: hypothetical protein KBF78_08075 [Fuscovulum sp.]|jgi:hypothetical protein|nr:hypothetical protein [Fuscovulum sp.]
MRRALALSAMLMALASAPVHAEGEVAEGEEAAEPLPYVEVPVNLNGVDYLAVIDISGEERMLVNGTDLDTGAHVPGAVRISRGDGASMADESYRAREVLEAACATQGFGVEPGIVPVLSPAGRWIFAGGCRK